MRKNKSEIRDDEARQIAQAMKRLIITFRAAIEDALQDEGITLAQLRMLHALEEQPGISAAELARLCHITPQSIQAVMTRAVKAGWIERHASDINRRVLVATLTQHGRNILRRGKDLSASINREVWGPVKLSELQAVRVLLTNTAERLEEIAVTPQRKQASLGKTA